MKIRTKKKLENKIIDLENKVEFQKKVGIGAGTGLAAAELLTLGCLIGQRLSIRKLFTQTWDKIDELEFVDDDDEESV